MKRNIPVQERFERHFIPEPNSGCWLWTASVIRDGYGRFRVGQRLELAHRVSFELYCGQIPDGMQTLHKCDNPCCVNPDHLFVGSVTDNMRDMVAKDRNAKRNRAKIPLDAIPRILEQASRGVLHREIATEFGVTRAAISHLVRKAA